MSGVTTSTLLAASIGTSVLGAGMSVAGGIQQGQAQAAQANYQSQVARNNVTLAQRNAAIATQQGEVQAQDSAMKTLQTEGAQKAALASQGGDIDTGSNAGIIGDTAMAGAADQQTLRYNAMMKAYGYDIEATGAAGTASADTAAASNATSMLPFSVGSTLLGAASSATGKWFSYMAAPPSGVTIGNPTSTILS